MSVTAYFSDTYAEAREKFLASAKAAGAALKSWPHPLKGPDGEDLAMDVALFGSKDAKRMLIMSSGTHGIEGFCGSGIQIGLIENGLVGELPDDTCLLMIHAHNPHGFAWQRRVTEDNVDLNRNFRDFGSVGVNEAYSDIHPFLVPGDWDGPERAAADKGVAEFIQTRGMPAFQAAVTGGQHDHPDGLFFGGQKATWSRLTLEEVAREYCGKATDIALLDLHTGLGPRGYGELISVDMDRDDEYERAQAWYGEVTSPSRGSSTSAPITGTIDAAWRDGMGDANLTAVAIEYGTLPPAEVLGSLQADNWLHLHGDLNSDQGRQIKAQVRAAFFGEEEKWKQDVYDRALETARNALKGLAG